MVDDELIVIESILAVPQPGAAERIDSVADVHEVLEELRSDVFIRRLLQREFQRHGKHGEAERCHPRRAVRLVEAAATGQRVRSIKHPDVIQSEESAAEDVSSLDILAVHPPGEIQQQLLECPLQEKQVPLALLVRDLVNPPHRPGMHGWVHIREIPLVRRELPVRVHVPLAKQEQKLLLREIRIDR